jgi:hypothetical protein
MNWLNKFNDKLYKLLPHLWGYLWLMIITTASVTTLVACVKWLLRTLELI